MDETSCWKFIDTPLDVQSLADSAFKSFSLLEPWHQVSDQDGHHLVLAMVQKICIQGNSYLCAIKMSIQTASAGQALAVDALDLCGFLTENHQYPNDLEIYLKSMIDIATGARQLALDTADKFRCIRRNLFEISRQIPIDLAEIKKANQQYAQTDDTIFIKLPPALPIVFEGDLPVIRPENRPRKPEKQSLNDVVDKLERAHSDLDELIRHVSQFADWWQIMETGLCGLLDVIPQMQRDSSNTLRMKNIRKRWEEVQRSYVLYHRQIGLIQDSHPSLGNHKCLCSSPCPKFPIPKTDTLPLPPTPPPRLSDHGTDEPLPLAWSSTQSDHGSDQSVEAKSSTRSEHRDRRPPAGPLFPDVSVSSIDSNYPVKPYPTPNPLAGSSKQPKIGTDPRPPARHKEERPPPGPLLSGALPSAPSVDSEKTSKLSHVPDPSVGQSTQRDHGIDPRKSSGNKKGNEGLSSPPPPSVDLKGPTEPVFVASHSPHTSVVPDNKRPIALAVQGEQIQQKGGTGCLARFFRLIH